jgi:hypothetical protein
MGKYILILEHHFAIFSPIHSKSFFSIAVSVSAYILKISIKVLLKLCVQVRKDDSQSHAGVVRLIQLLYCLLILKIL